MNPHSFQLLEQPWVPVELLDGRSAELSLVEVFERAAEIRRITDPSPLVTMALYRLLFAIFHRAVPVRSSEEIGLLWDEGDAHLRVLAYLRRWHHRFDLFDREAPFWQIPDLTSEYGVMSWAKLAAELNDNNNKVLFDHTRTVGEGRPTASAAEVARALVACQMLSVGAGRSRVGYNVNATLATTLLVLPEAENLSDTLVANAQPVESADDLPIWEQEVVRVADLEKASTASEGHAWKGLASRLTWLTRAIRIDPPDEDGRVVTITFGAGLRPAVPDGDRDPWAAYRVSKDAEWVPQRLSLEKAVWRELHAIAIQSEKDKHDVARVFQGLARLRDLDRPLPKTWTLLVAGQAADKAKILGWSQQRWRVPDSVMQHRDLGVEVMQATEESIATAGLLWRLAFRMAGDLLTRSPDRKVDVSEQGRVARALPTQTAYWSTLERAFARFLLDLGDRSGRDRDEVIDQARARWEREIADAISASERATHRVMGRDARSLRAWARTGPRFGQVRAKHLARAKAYEGVKS